MYCPACGTRLAAEDKFCGICGKHVSGTPEQEAYCCDAAPPVPPVRKKRWKLWIPIAVLILIFLIGIYFACFYLLRGLVAQLPTHFSIVQEWSEMPDLQDGLPGFSEENDLLEQTWMLQITNQSGAAEAALLLSFEDGMVSLDVMTEAGIVRQGSYTYVTTGIDSFYVPAFNQTFTFEIDARGQTLLLQPGIVLDAVEEEWVCVDP